MTCHSRDMAFLLTLAEFSHCLPKIPFPVVDFCWRFFMHIAFFMHACIIWGNLCIHNIFCYSFSHLKLNYICTVLRKELQEISTVRLTSYVYKCLSIRKVCIRLRQLCSFIYKRKQCKNCHIVPPNSNGGLRLDRVAKWNILVPYPKGR